MKNRKKPIGIIITISIVLLLTIVTLLGWAYYNSKLDLIQYDDGSKEIDTSTSYAIDNDELDIADFPDAPEDVDTSGGIEILEGDIYHDDDVINILLLGTDERTDEFNENARADAIMVMSLNTKEHTLKLISIERGIGVPVPGRNDDWITHTFRYGGAALTMQTVRDCFKLDVERYVRVNFNVVSKAIDKIGGVDIELTQAEAEHLNSAKKNYYESGSDIQTVHAGTNHLNGDTAMAYARIRKIDSDWKRIERQRTVIQAAINQVKNSDIFTLNALADAILPMVQTNLTKAEITRLMRDALKRQKAEVKDIDKENSKLEAKKVKAEITRLMLEVPAFLSEGSKMEQMTIPTYETCWNSVGVDGRKMIGVDFEANAQILKEFFYGVS